MASGTQDDVAEKYRDLYRQGLSEARRRLDQRVFGSDHGTTGWTSLAEADEIAHRLALEPSDRLLDLGTGRGWPGLHLARVSGCELVLLDQPVDGLQHALSRADRDGIADQVVAVAAAGDGLPLRPKSVDAVVHTDVLC